MSTKTNIGPDDWRVTAYALGELDGTEVAAVEAALAASAELRAEVAAIRRAGDELLEAYAGDLVSAAAGDVGTGLPAVSSGGAPLAKSVATGWTLPAWVSVAAAACVTLALLSPLAGDRSAGPQADHPQDVGGNSEQPVFAKAQELADERRFAEAAGVMDRLVEVDPTNETARFRRDVYERAAGLEKQVALADAPVGGRRGTSTGVDDRFPHQFLAAGKGVQTLYSFKPAEAEQLVRRRQLARTAGRPEMGQPPGSELPSSRLNFRGYNGLSYGYQLPYHARAGLADGAVALGDKWYAGTEAVPAGGAPGAAPGQGGGQGFPANDLVDAEAIRRGLTPMVGDIPVMDSLGRDRRENLGFFDVSPDGLSDLAYVGGVDPNAIGAERAARERYAAAIHNPFLPSAAHPLSTFSIDVDTASYANARRMLAAGELPPPGAVRVEEFVNYFDYDYAEPTVAEPFSVALDVAECPWQPEHLLMRVALKGYETPPGERPSANLVFLIDVSGSMNDAAKLPLVQAALELLVNGLYPDDSVAIVVYAGAAGMVLPPTSGERTSEILAALENLKAGGSTNGGEGIALAYQVATEQFIEGGINRVMLATDGDFNVGISDHDALVALIREQAAGGVFLTALGFGFGDLNDHTLEQLADNGNGQYAYIDSLAEARRVLVDELGGTLLTIAKDVKVQVEFNPARVDGYRLLGYENRTLAARDFNDDRVDAGEIGSGHTVTALYELVPAGALWPVPSPAMPRYELDAETAAAQAGHAARLAEDDTTGVLADPGVDPLRYVTPGALAAEALGVDGAELATVKLRYKLPDEDASRLIERTVIDRGRTLGELDPDFRFAAAAASFALRLRGAPGLEAWTLGQTGALAVDGSMVEADPQRAEFLGMVDQAARLLGEGD